MVGPEPPSWPSEPAPLPRTAAVPAACRPPEPTHYRRAFASNRILEIFALAPRPAAHRIFPPGNRIRADRERNLEERAAVLSVPRAPPSLRAPFCGKSPRPPHEHLAN